jgi:anterior pharynx defective protein 1
MTSFALTLSCALLAFSPSLTLLLLFTYSKAQLVIVVTTSAFFQLLSCLLSSLIHLPFRFMDTNAVYIIIPTSVASQALFRCAFVKIYHKVERVIEKSIQRHESENRDETRNSSDQTEEASEVNLLRLELNDVSCGLASGVGFGFMHTVMLYGTLLASENNRIGTLYQESCTVMPSIFNSALMAFMFGILDIVWMMLSFYGMRRLNGIGRISEWSFTKGHIGGKAALAFVFASHLAASFATLPNEIFSSNGCYIALPVLATITIVTCSLAWIYCNEKYLPEGQKDRIRQVRHLD